MDPSVLGTGSCPEKIGKFGEASAYLLDLFLPDSQEEYSTLHPMLALIHYGCFHPFPLAHLPSPKSQSFVVGILVDVLLIIIVLIPILFVFLSESVTPL